jgi:hypothetical protein
MISTGGYDNHIRVIKNFDGASTEERGLSDPLHHTCNPHYCDITEFLRAKRGPLGTNVDVNMCLSYSVLVHTFKFNM